MTFYDHFFLLQKTRDHSLHKMFLKHQSYLISRPNLITLIQNVSTQSILKQRLLVFTQHCILFLTPVYIININSKQSYVKTLLS